jgi:hypothetical protein
MQSDFDETGAELFSAALDARELSLLADLALRRLGAAAGVRLSGDPILSQLLAPGGALDRIARAKIGEGARPVRAILFDKTAETNWALGWHQDRTIAVRARRDAPGFGPWSRKAGAQHVEPPFEIMAQMVTLRAHLDACGEDNAPLLVAKSSHLQGRIPAETASDLATRSETFACLAAPGDIWAYRSAILHASEASRVKTHRRVLHIDYAAFDLPHGLEWLGV